MKILVISTNVFPCPPTGYAGLEMISWQCAEGLQAKGHDVTLVAPTGSKTNCTLFETIQGESERSSFNKYQDKLKDFDVIIDHSWLKWSYIGKLRTGFKAPILGVCHAPINTMYQSAPPLEKPCLVSISKDQGQSISEHLKVDYRNVYNGVDTTFYKHLNKNRNNRYLFLARFSSIKGPHIAVDVANECSVGLDLIGDNTITNEPDLMNYINNVCNSSPNLRLIGPQSRQECATWFNMNKALLHPNQLFREPFGLAPVEAQLCGMPVIAWDNGAMRETVKHGETGFLVNSKESMVDLIKSDAISAIKPERCIEWSSKFSFENMVQGYEDRCKEAIEGGW